MARKPDLSDRARYHHIRETKGKYRVVLEIDPGDPSAGRPRQQAQRSFPTTPVGLKDALSWRDITQGAISSGTYARPSSDPVLRGPGLGGNSPALIAHSPTFADLVERFLVSRAGEVRPSTVHGYRNALALPIRKFGERDAGDLTVDDILLLRDALQNELTRTGKVASHRTMVYTLLAVRLVLDFGVTAGALERNVAKTVRAPRKSTIKTRKPSPPTWGPEELRQFVEYVLDDPSPTDRRDPRHGGWVRPAYLLSCCGLRRGEVLGLAWEAVDSVAESVQIEASRTRTGGKNGETDRDDAKSGNSRRLIRPNDIHHGTQDALEALRESKNVHRLEGPIGSSNPDDLVFVDSVGRPIDPETYRARFRRLCLGAGVRPVGLHRIRHTLANLMHDNGVPPKRAADLLGHSLEVHLSRYITSTQQGTDEAARTIGRTLWDRD
jgi:integrase